MICTYLVIAPHYFTILKILQWKINKKNSTSIEKAQDLMSDEDDNVKYNLIYIIANFGTLASNTKLETSGLSFNDLIQKIKDIDNKIESAAVNRI